MCVMNDDIPRQLFIEELTRVLGGNNAPIEDDMSGISKPGIDNEGPDGGLDGGLGGGLDGGGTEI